MTRTSRKLFNALEKQLASQRDELRMRIDRHRMDVVMDRELDDEAAAAVGNVSRDMVAATLERERRTLKEIESALIRMKKGDYGTCAAAPRYPKHGSMHYLGRAFAYTVPNHH